MRNIIEKYGLKKTGENTYVRKIRGGLCFARVVLSEDEKSASVSFHLGEGTAGIANCYFPEIENRKERMQKADRWLDEYIRLIWKMLIRSQKNDFVNAKEYEKTFENISSEEDLEKTLKIITGKGAAMYLNYALADDIDYALKNLMLRER